MELAKAIESERAAGGPSREVSIEQSPEFNNYRDVVQHLKSHVPPGITVATFI